MQFADGYTWCYYFIIIFIRISSQYFVNPSYFLIGCNNCAREHSPRKRLQCVLKQDPCKHRQQYMYTRKFCDHCKGKQVNLSPAECFKVCQTLEESRSPPNASSTESFLRRLQIGPIWRCSMCHITGCGNFRRASAGTPGVLTSCLKAGWRVGPHFSV